MLLWISCFFLTSLMDEILSFKTAPFNQNWLFFSLFIIWYSLSSDIILTALYTKEQFWFPFVNFQYFLTMSLCCPHHLLQRLFSLPVPLNCFSCNRTQAQEVLNISDEESGTSNIMWLQSVLWSSWNNIWWGFNRLFLWHLNVIHQPKTPFISFVFHLYITGKKPEKHWTNEFFFSSSSLFLFPIFWVVF